MRKLIALLALVAIIFTSCTKAEAPSVSSKPDWTFGPAPSQSVPEPENVPAYPPIPLSEGGYRAMWISYLEWASFDTKTQDSFTQNVAKVLDNCVRIGVNTVIVQVRPFADAIYESELFPKSHLLTGTQGGALPYDAFNVFITQARERGLKIEAWINPYRVALNDKMPGSYAETNLKNTHPEWVKEANKGLYLEPSNPDVQKYIVDGVKEVCTKYDIDGVQFDDYFYPTTDEAFDKDEFNALGGKMALADWRRENVNTLLRAVYSAIKEIDPTLTFGISPQGNNDNNYNQQYSDVALWMSTPGYCDYVMPQLYWGFNYTTKSGDTQYQFKTLTQKWAGFKRAEGVRLYIGLGAWRIGAGDGGSNEQDEWQSGHNIADMIKLFDEIAGIDGFALYRYDSLFNNPEHAERAKIESSTLEKYFSNK